MSRDQLVAELEKLTPEERWALFEHFWPPELRGPTEEEKALLDRELEDYRKNPDRGEPADIVFARLRPKK
jgi:putative addiction module component (TIGR02574 family)